MVPFVTRKKSTISDFRQNSTRELSLLRNFKSAKIFAISRFVPRFWDNIGFNIFFNSAHILILLVLLFLQYIFKEIFLRNSKKFQLFFISYTIKKIFKHILDLFCTNFDQYMQISVEWSIIEINQFCFSHRKLRQRTVSQRNVQRNQRIINSVACIQTSSQKIEKSVEKPTSRNERVLKIPPMVQ